MSDPPTDAAPLSGGGPWWRRAHRRLHRWFLSLLGAHQRPSRLFAAVLVGAIIGTTPFFGLHLPICIAAAWLLRLNQVTVYAAANISLPPLLPLLGYASVQVGERLLHRRWLEVTVADFRAAPMSLAGRFFLDWLAGAVVVGGAIGLLLGTLVYLAARGRERRAADPLHPILVAAARRYRPAPRAMRFYAWFKYRLDPCYRAIAALVPPGSFTVDLGTGLGMLPVVLALLPGERRTLGVEWDEAKLAAGRVAAADLAAVELRQGDVRAVAIPPCDTITIVDLLHYYDAPTQRALLGRCAAALRPGGQLLIREGDAARRGGGAWTRGVEEAAVQSGWNRGQGRTRFRPIEELAADLRNLGLTVEAREVAGRLHPGNVLLRGRKAGGTKAAAPD